MYQLSPSAVRPAAEMDALFTIIFGLDVRGWLHDLIMKQETEDNICAASSDVEQTLLQDYH